LNREEHPKDRMRPEVVAVVVIIMLIIAMKLPWGMF
jgi:hypothetical protein